MMDFSLMATRLLSNIRFRLTNIRTGIQQSWFNRMYRRVAGIDVEGSVYIMVKRYRKYGELTYGKTLQFKFLR